MRQLDQVCESPDSESIQCALDFENTMNNLETQLYYRHLPPKEVALRVMEAACKFYDADWCGLIQVDLDLGLWKPLWWHNECQEDKTTILTNEFESSEFLDRWVKAVRRGTPMVVPDAEEVKDLYEGYGPQHIATYLNNSGYRARSGKCWHPSSIRGMVQNLTYTGVLRCGDARSELMPDLQIVPQEQFENAQRIRNERSVRSTAEAENRLPLNIHGKSLLAGNAYCGHCGAKLELTSSRKWRKMADGSLDDTLRIRYTCYGKLRKQTNCTGQTGYTVHILDEIIDKAVRQIFSKMRGIPKEQIVTKRYEKETTERKNHLQDLQTQRDKAEKDLLSLKAEILACIKGESVLPRETLAEMITEQEEKLKELEDLCESASEELERTAELMDKVSRLYDELISYADLYDSANFEAKKMVVNQLIRRVDVYRGYQINISFNFDLTPYIEGE